MGKRTLYKKKYYEREKINRYNAEPQCEVCGTRVSRETQKRINLWFEGGMTLCTPCKDKLLARRRTKEGAKEYRTMLRKHKGLR